MAPLERSGLVFGRVLLSARAAPVEAGITPEMDILSVHLTSFQVEARNEGRLIHAGMIHRNSVSLAQAGLRSEVILTGDIDIIQLFLPRPRLSELAAELHGRPVHLRFGKFEHDTQLAAIAQRAADLAASPNAAERLHGDVAALRVAARLLQTFGGEAQNGERRKLLRGGLSPWQLKLVTDFMEDQLASDVALSTLAEKVGLSGFHFIRAFKESTQLTPHVWLLQRRIARIKSHLSSRDADHSEIARLTGYSSPSAMAAAFRRGTGLSPSEWRRSLGWPIPN